MLDLVCRKNFDRDIECVAKEVAEKLSLSTSAAKAVIHSKAVTAGLKPCSTLEQVSANCKSRAVLRLRAVRLNHTVIRTIGEAVVDVPLFFK